VNNQILITIFIIIIYIHFINGESSIYSDMTYNDIPKYLTKDEVVKIKNVFFIAFIVKTIYVLRLITATLRILWNFQMKMDK